MNTPKHTPGPWRISEADACIWPTVGRRAPIATLFTALEPESEGSDERDGLSQEEWANRALLASAPELLEALREAVTWLQSAQADEPQGYYNEPLDNAIEQALAAIAKAEGRQ